MPKEQKRNVLFLVLKKIYSWHNRLTIIIFSRNCNFIRHYYCTIVFYVQNMCAFYCGTDSVKINYTKKTHLFKVNREQIHNSLSFICIQIYFRIYTYLYLLQLRIPFQSVHRLWRFCSSKYFESMPITLKTNNECTMYIKYNS